MLQTDASVTIRPPMLARMFSPKRETITRYSISAPDLRVRAIGATGVWGVSCWLIQIRSAAVVLRGVEIDLDSDIGYGFIVDCSRFCEALLGEAEIKLKRLGALGQQRAISPSRGNGKGARIEAARELRQVATGGAESTPATGDRFIIRIDLTRAAARWLSSTRRWQSSQGATKRLRKAMNHSISRRHRYATATIVKYCRRSFSAVRSPLAALGVLPE